MKVIQSIGRTLVVAIAFGSAVLGTLTISAPRAQALPPRLLCGPTILWICTMPGGSEVLFGGTVCEKIAFERQTGSTCVPYGG
jgi:hypothetical protein